MDILLVILSGIFLLIGFLGCFLPVLPGPPISWLGILLLHFTKYADFSITFLVLTCAITLLLTIFDYVLPSWAVKRKGGSKAGEKGAFVGSIVGIFLGPFGILLGPFLGAFVGEFMTKNGDVAHSVKIALSSWTGFLLSTGLKLLWCGILFYLFLKEMMF